ncbi:hypothetical protein F5141DRAFT_1209454 [Pisolithus sp. B1]|nr:hypothetical protein F5141DRAFT_1209454 [Pisolithus sp. B1]
MSQQQSSSRQPTDAPAQDWAQVPDMDLEVHMSNSEGTKQAKEAKKGKWEALRKEKQAEACRQKAEEACLERERQEWEEHERQELAAEAEAVQQSVAKDRGRVGELWVQSWVSSTGGPQLTPVFSSTTGAQIGTMVAPPAIVTVMVFNFS